jgi:hypothetical protein
VAVFWVEMIGVIFFGKSVAFKSSRLKPAIFFGLAKGNLSTQSLAEGQRQWERQ